jgi:phage tail sheath protein FI
MQAHNRYVTPGVFIEEYDAFPRSVVPVPTAIPAFVGYTETAEVDSKPAYLLPIEIASLADYQTYFGGAFNPVFEFTQILDDKGQPVTTPPDQYDLAVTQTGATPPITYYKLTPKTQYNMYNSIQMFFANGGGSCWVISVGAYSAAGFTTADDLLKGLTAVQDQYGPTLLAVPDAVLLPLTDKATSSFASAEYTKVVDAMLTQCGALQDRFAILDVYGAGSISRDSISDPDRGLTACVTAFSAAIGTNPYVSYGSAYFPFINTSVIPASNIDFTSFDPNQAATMTGVTPITGATPATPAKPSEFWTLLTVVNQDLYPADKDGKNAQQLTVQGYINQAAVPPTTPQDAAAATAAAAALATLNQNLVNALPPLKQWESIVLGKSNTLPPSGAMAGVYALSDQTRGVWNAPANMSLQYTISPTISLKDSQQGPLNVPLDGKAIDVIRYFTGQGTMVWGARTLDGNSNDWRYTQVRRTVIWIEQTIKLSLNQYVFGANVSTTWVSVVGMISNFLQSVWAQGGLMGDKATDAFNVQCGLGSTMTSQDILDGYMVVSVTLQLVHPAEYIVLQFTQKMGS